jgi:hypothetical protein
MPIPTYTPGYPPDGSSLGETKATIRNNLDGTFQTLNVDHVNNNGQPGSRPAGYHTIIHEVPQTNVTTVAGYNQIFCGVPGTLVVNSVLTPAIPPGSSGVQLYSLNGMGTLAQLTGYSANANGYCWAGGILFQWGTTSATSSANVPVSFTPNFPIACYNVQAIPIRAATSPGNDFACCIVTGSVSAAGFTIGNIGAHSVAGFYWFAIGK